MTWSWSSDLGDSLVIGHSNMAIMAESFQTVLVVVAPSGVTLAVPRFNVIHFEAYWEHRSPPVAICSALEAISVIPFKNCLANLTPTMILSPPLTAGVATPVAATASEFSPASPAKTLRPFFNAWAVRNLYHTPSNPLSSYTLSPSPPMARLKAMIAATIPSIRSVDFFLVGLMLSVASVSITALAAHHFKTGLS